MTTITGAARSNSWNVQLFIENKAIAGVFQRSDLLTIADLAHELDLCFIIDKSDGWQMALLPRATEPADRSLIILDHQGETPLPTPSKVDQYTLVFHSSSQCKTRGRHTLEDSCIRYMETPARRADPRYLEIGEQSPAFQGVPPMRKKRRSSSSSTKSWNSSPSSPAKMDDNPDEPRLPRPDIIHPEQARRLINDFRDNVSASPGTLYTNTCVFTGQGRSWFSGGPGPGLQAAHIIPRIH
ncbi:hypothetical protein VM1G_02580 [Cytospora mali]|uniref:HNH nuclease domain-containing protein n=1 Tax=Cytospora mali TaxID=578113 RepID=A0A194VU53_CYTMA|nr:hypothetical protein VM1G_02580 [Valsa mali]